MKCNWKSVLVHFTTPCTKSQSHYHLLVLLLSGCSGPGSSLHFPQGWRLSLVAELLAQCYHTNQEVSYAKGSYHQAVFPLACISKTTLDGDARVDVEKSGASPLKKKLQRLQVWCHTIHMGLIYELLISSIPGQYGANLFKMAVLLFEPNPNPQGVSRKKPSIFNVCKKAT